MKRENGLSESLFPDPTAGISQSSSRTLLFFRRRAAAAATATKPQQPCAAGLATAARHDALDSGGGARCGEGSKNRWVELPPFAPLDANAAARAISGGGGGGGGGEGSDATAVRWVRRCCPNLPASLVQKLFRQRKVKKNFVNADTSSTDASPEQLRLRRVETDNGFLLSLQHVQLGKNGIADNAGPPVFLQHGLFQLFWDWSWQELAEYDLLAS
ncbi:hypothetical protein ACP70R_023503 [Stipagrostis hirtigluma subsp. patula]